MKEICVSILLIGFALLTGCENTLAGFGSDMQQNGKKIENSAKSN
jgi:predicted small secreted protein